MFVQVIVDVPARETDRPFDYAVPERWRHVVEIGSRVGVPFGARVIQGFVVGLSEQAGTDAAKIREIREIPDLVPPLTEELVGLARWVSRTYLCSEIAALQAMLPGALKAKYDRHYAVNEAEAERWLAHGDCSGEELAFFRILQERGQWSAADLADLSSRELAWLKRWVGAGILTEEQIIQDRLSVKKIRMVRPALPPERLREAVEQLPAQARKQRELAAWFLERPEPLALQDLLAAGGAGSAAVKALADKGMLKVYESEVYRDPYADKRFDATRPLTLTEEQERVFRDVGAALDRRKSEVFLLHGVTGSGKTEVYLQWISVCLAQGREAIVLVPEISLTPQMVERFKGRFGALVAVLHSRLSQGERYDEWRKIRLGKVKVAIGARSAVFAPFCNLGLIIIDEEHEASYKQEDSPKYHARELAIERAKAHGAAVVLGSATPSLESYHAAGGGLSVYPGSRAGGSATANGIAAGTERAEEPAYRMLAMPSRVEGRPLPAVRVVDMREELKAGNRSMFSRPLRQGIEERLARGEQMVLLLNRRGHSTFVMCRSCGVTLQCPNCDISLTYHQRAGTVRCHYCGYAEREPEKCPDCGSPHIRFFGTGTQRVEEELAKAFPALRVIRMDVDTTNFKGAHEKLLAQFRDQKADCLLGTQMVAKGLDFPNVTLVGVIAADTVLNLPDFRAAERTFQLLTQVAGRAGRGQLPGEVVIQSYTPEHYSIAASAGHDYQAFAERELRLRRIRGYPPYRRLLLLTLSHERLPEVIRAAEALCEALKLQGRRHFARMARSEPGGREAPEGAAAAAGTEERYEVYGPVASPIPRLKNRFRFQIILKYEETVPAPQWTQQAVNELKLNRQDGLRVAIDVDPQSMM